MILGDRSVQYGVEIIWPNRRIWSYTKWKKKCVKSYGPKSVWRYFRVI